MILIVEDHRDTAYILCRLLGQSGYRCDHRICASEALAVLLSEPVKLVILDVMLPGMDGFELAEAIRAMPHCAGLPLVFHSANDDIDRQRRAREVGAVAFLLKGSVTFPQILAVVARHAGPPEAAKRSGIISPANRAASTTNDC